MKPSEDVHKKANSTFDAKDAVIRPNTHLPHHCRMFTVFAGGRLRCQSTIGDAHPQMPFKPPMSYPKPHIKAEIDNDSPNASVIQRLRS